MSFLNEEVSFEGSLMRREEPLEGVPSKRVHVMSAWRTKVGRPDGMIVLLTVRCERRMYTALELTEFTKPSHSRWHTRKVAARQTREADKRLDREVICFAFSNDQE